jgi:hypothetical protein
MSKSFLLEQTTNLLQNPLSWRTRVFLFRVSFSWTGCSPWLTSSAYPPPNPWKRPFPGATHRASGTWSSHKTGSPLAAVALSLVGLPTFCLQSWNYYDKIVMQVVVQLKLLYTLLIFLSLLNVNDHDQFWCFLACVFSRLIHSLITVALMRCFGSFCVLVHPNFFYPIVIWKFCCCAFLLLIPNVDLYSLSKMKYILMYRTG